MCQWALLALELSLNKHLIRVLKMGQDGLWFPEWRYGSFQMLANHRAAREGRREVKFLFAPSGASRIVRSCFVNYLTIK